MVSLVILAVVFGLGCLKHYEEKRGGEDILPGLTGMAGGKEYMISVKAVQASRTMFATKPRVPIQKGPWGMELRPRMRRQMTGMA